VRWLLHCTLEAETVRTHTRETQQSMTPERSLEFLQEGNERFMQNLAAHRNLLDQVNDTREGQFPFATILSCIDSRTSSELVFDQGLGDIFSIRIAGNVVNDDVLGSMEFSCAVAGSKLLVVLGHSDCGAVKGACDHVQLGNLSTLLNRIQPALYLERTIKEDRTSKNPVFVERVSEIHVRRSLEAILERSPVLRKLIEAGKVGLIGAVYSLETGRVTFLQDTWMCGELRHFFLNTTEERPPEQRQERRAEDAEAHGRIA
jgi:carbonic anhydrase